MDAPKTYKDAGFLVLVGGVLNIITGFLWFISLFWLCIGFMWLIPMSVGIYQVIVGLAMQKGTPHPRAGMIGILGLVAGVFNVNPIAIITGFMAMSKVKEPDVAGFLSGS